MKFFNSNFLKLIFERYGAFKIFVNSEYLQITDIVDITDLTGYSNGEPRRFNCEDIQEVMVGTQIYTLDSLNPEEPKEEEPKEKGDEEAEPEAEPKPKGKEEPKPEEPKKREESFKSGDRVAVLSENYGLLKGIVDLTENRNVFVKVYNVNLQKFERFCFDKGEVKHA